MTSEVGSTANRYEILAKLATGGMAEIFLARGVGAVGVARYVVLKRILREFASNVSFVRMFIDEARLVAQLQHPNIAQVHDVGQLGDSYFFTMEYVHGETVRALLSQTRKHRRQFPLGAVLTIAAGAAVGLHHAHERLSLDGKPLGIVHRDVTPSNVMVSFEGNVKVLDFGVAKAGDRASETKSGTIKGKTSYLSPEQCQSMELDRRSDLFSLGIVMWEMLTCERLFRLGSEFESMSAIVNTDAAPPSSINPQVPPDVDALVKKLLARDRADRFDTAQAVIDAIEDIAVHHQVKLSASVLVRMMRDTFGSPPSRGSCSSSRSCPPRP
ncbi:MAG: serine/threonine-protein kinase [Proteobacteria bacterium]|nr:serine/threonine-protein kinase [Pseudomonadota bacterium]